ncbi:amino acid deaminase/aldolase [Dietzia cinnamea]|uniref:Amino acid deaminase/aldolase n=1 Tax=Dietzia cinnamea TaxID=321318 RepID=A0AAW5QBE9_9ACTN|nr:MULTISPECIES: alanine racemase [Dietzia]MBM7229375.1 amino acid deaminase/aldolase [Dietzia cinnamea]MCT1865309.1 amino acid deaminase/aldolase [Dietzia cinnamea]MCT2031329.1 amino acid deaminase/aldolase [Dietzia cinnamea]MCT2034779.1 amino acid deaminase/aldolase [Dietzia cinnamea]MCT2077313.1 amino acid deaminase/aldolase [Dietzia cinnamea]
MPEPDPAHHRAVAGVLDTATAGIDAPLAVLHLPSLRANLDDLRRRAGGTRIRIAGKSVRSRGVLREVLGADLHGDATVRGIMAYSLAEALWLVDSGCDDVLVGYPTVDRSALVRLGADADALDAVTLMVDDPRQLAIAREAGASGARVCIDVDSSLRLGPVHLGVRRSPLRTPEDVAPLVRHASDEGFRVVGAMFYEAQVAGVPDDVPGIGLVKHVSMRRLRGVREAVAGVIADITGEPPEIINSGGTGSVAESAAAPAVTEVTAGSGLYAPGLFDAYRSFTPRPALMFALPAVRRPASGLTTFLYGGYVASGPPGGDRLPVPVAPAGMRYLGREGAGEVQTPVRGEVPIGGRAWWRHAKAGELCERFDTLHVVDETADGPALVDRWPTYRGEGKCFG